MAWGMMMNRMVCTVAQAQGAARLHLAHIHAHQAAADDLRHIGAGVDAQGQDAHHGNSCGWWRR